MSLNLSNTFTIKLKAMKNILTTFLLLLCFNLCFSFTTEKSKTLNYSETITKYGNNETSKAIIDVFFINSGVQNLSGNSTMNESNVIYNYINLVKALKDFQKNKKIDPALKQEVDKLIEKNNDITEEGYNNLMNATLKKINN